MSYQVIATVLYILLGIIGLFMSLFSVMLFDAPGSENNPFTWLAVLAICSLPITCLVSLIGSWHCYRMADIKKLNIFYCLPFISVILIVVAFVAIEILYDGKLNG